MIGFSGHSRIYIGLAWFTTASPGIGKTGIIIWDNGSSTATIVLLALIRINREELSYCAVQSRGIFLFHKLVLGPMTTFQI
jgi:hypothetical protein